MDKTDNYAMLLLQSKLLELKLKQKHLRLEMATYPNQYTDDALSQIEPMVNDLILSINKLEEKK